MVTTMPPPVRHVELPEAMAVALRQMIAEEQTGSFTVHLAKGVPLSWEARSTGRIQADREP